MTPTEAMKYLRTEVDMLPLELSSLCYTVVNDPRFSQRVGSSEHHHEYEGGLAVHTAEVVQYARKMGEAFGADLVVLLTAAICHDYHKIYDYDAAGNKTWYRKHIRHVAGGTGWFLAKAEEHGIAEEQSFKIAHCIVSHHGRVEWGSPIEPLTLEAFLLHTADMLSAFYLNKTRV